MRYLPQAISDTQEQGDVRAILAELQQGVQLRPVPDFEKMRAVGKSFQPHTEEVAVEAPAALGPVLTPVPTSLASYYYSVATNQIAQII